MDVLTTLGYVSILVLVIANVLIVSRMKIEVQGEEEE